MSQKEVQKKREVQIEEDKDFYLSFLNKKLRNSRKKLEQIEELAKKDAKTLKPEQVEKINARADVLQTIQHFEGLKDLYYQAYKIGIEEGKVTPKESSTEANRKSVQVHETANAAEVGKQGHASRDEIIKETVQKVLNLLTFSQVLQNPIGREELAQVETGLDGLQQFCQNLNLSPLERSLNVSERKSDTLDKIVSYVRSEETSAVGETSYRQVQEAIERIVVTSTFTKLDLTPKETPTSQIQTIEAPIVEAVEQERVQEVQVQEEELSTGAAVLKPDTSDSNASPGSAQYHPKVVRFVDEIEKDMLAQSPKKENVDAVTEPAKGILKESTREAVNEEEREGEQKSFRKKRNNEQGGGKYYNGERKTQPNRGGQGQGQYSYKKGGYKENKYSRGGRDEEYYQPRGGYQVKEYVEKKPQAA